MVLSYIDPTHLRVTWEDPATGESHHHVQQFPIFIGRAPSINNIVLDNAQVSRQHAQLTYQEGQIIISDQESTNGIIVNGERVKYAVLPSGSSFQIGPFTFTAVPWMSAPGTVRM